jgi:hypothetical protein
MSPLSGPTPLRYSMGLFNMETELEMIITFSVMEYHKYNKEESREF